MAVSMIERANVSLPVAFIASTQVLRSSAAFAGSGVAGGADIAGGVGAGTGAGSGAGAAAGSAEPAAVGWAAAIPADTPRASIKDRARMTVSFVAFTRVLRDRGRARAARALHAR